MKVKPIWDNEVLYYKYPNLLTNEIMITTNMGLYGDPRWDDVRYAISDLSEVMGIKDFTPDDVSQIAAFDSPSMISCES